MANDDRGGRDGEKEENKPFFSESFKGRRFKSLIKSSDFKVITVFETVKSNLNEESDVIYSNLDVLFIVPGAVSLYLIDDELSNCI